MKWRARLSSPNPDVASGIDTHCLCPIRLDNKGFVICGSQEIGGLVSARIAGDFPMLVDHLCWQKRLKVKRGRGGKVGEKSDEEGNAGDAVAR
jgi:hypothetical protein